MATEQKKLTRLPDEGQIAGVCAGLGKYFDIDVTLMRVIFVLLAFMTGGGFILVYLVLIVVLPVEHTVATASKAAATTRQDAPVRSTAVVSTHAGHLRNWLGIGLIVLGAWLLLGMVFPYVFSFRWDVLWPVILILIGLFIATKRR